MPVLRSRRAALLAKIEATPGVDATPTTADAVLCENLRLTFDNNLVQTNEHTGSLDPQAPIVGGTRVQLAFDTYLRGSGAAATPPEFGPLFEMGGWEKVEQAAVGAESLVSGTTTGATLSSAATAVAQAYRGMPIQFSNVTTPSNTFITDYTAGKVATLANPAPDGVYDGADYAIPANVLYRPTSSVALDKYGTIYAYMDGVLIKVFGARTTFVLTMAAGQAARFAWTVTGMWGGKTDAAVPAIGSFDTTRPPLWRDPNATGAGHFAIDRTEAALRQLVVTNGNQLVYPDNPNASEGFDPTELVSRRLTGTMDPLATLVATRHLMQDFRDGTQRLIHARLGTVAGNRFGLVIPAAAYEQYAPGDREGLATEEVGFFAAGQDAGAFLAFW